MTKTNKRKGTVRAPVQGRSLQRVNQILDASKTLIYEHGCAGLKMGDVATKANVSVGSIYQYYPNKQAIVADLASHYLESFREHTFDALKETPDSLDALWGLTLQLAHDAYRFHRNDLVVKDIWLGASTDKALQDLRDQDSALHLEMYFAQSKHLFKPSKHEKVKLALSLFIDFTKFAVYKAVELDEKAGKRSLETAMELLTSSWELSIKPMARASKKR